MFGKKQRFPWGAVAAAFVVGAASGAAAALLLTPMNGRKMQKQLRNVVEDQVDNVERIVKKVVG